jgi:hypothetical protein
MKRRELLQRSAAFGGLATLSRVGAPLLLTACGGVGSEEPAAGNAYRQTNLAATSASYNALFTYRVSRSPLRARANARSAMCSNSASLRQHAESSISVPSAGIARRRQRVAGVDPAAWRSMDGAVHGIAGILESVRFEARATGRGRSCAAPWDGSSRVASRKACHIQGH